MLALLCNSLLEHIFGNHLQQLYNLFLICSRNRKNNVCAKVKNLWEIIKKQKNNQDIFVQSKKTIYFFLCTHAQLTRVAVKGYSIRLLRKILMWLQISQWTYRISCLENNGFVLSNFSFIYPNLFSFIWLSLYKSIKNKFLFFLNSSNFKNEEFVIYYI